MHVTLVPWIAPRGELKTKPTQHSVGKELRAIGIQPDILMCRSERDLSQDLKEKIALFCDVNVEAGSRARCRQRYECPLEFAAQAVDDIALRLLNLETPRGIFARWNDMARRLSSPRTKFRSGCRQVRRVRRFV